MIDDKMGTIATTTAAMLPIASAASETATTAPPVASSSTGDATNSSTLDDDDVEVEGTFKNTCDDTKAKVNLSTSMPTMSVDGFHHRRQDVKGIGD